MYFENNYKKTLQRNDFHLMKQGIIIHQPTTSSHSFFKRNSRYEFQKNWDEAAIYKMQLKISDLTLPVQLPSELNQYTNS